MCSFFSSAFSQNRNEYNIHSGFVYSDQKPLACNFVFQNTICSNEFSFPVSKMRVRRVIVTQLVFWMIKWVVSERVKSSLFVWDENRLWSVSTGFFVSIESMNKKRKKKKVNDWMRISARYTIGNINHRIDPWSVVFNRTQSHHEYTGIVQKDQRIHIIPFRIIHREPRVYEKLIRMTRFNVLQFPLSSSFLSSIFIKENANQG